MATEVLMPRQGQSVESCLIVDWKKNVGDSVSHGDTLCEVETDKATFEVEAPASGVLLQRLYEANDDVPVLSPIAYIGEAGEAPPSSQPTENTQPSGSGQAQAAGNRKQASGRQHGADTQSRAPADSPVDAGGQRHPAAAVTDAAGATISPRARRLAEKHGIDYRALAGSGPAGRIIERDIESARASGAPLTPAARAAVAADPDGTAAPAEGTGIGGRVRAADLETAGDGLQTGAAPSVARDYPGPAEQVPLKGVRKVIAERMLASLQNSAQLTVTMSADARALLALRARFKQSGKELGLHAVTINDLVNFAVSRTLPRFNFMNSRLEDDTITVFRHVHLGFAVDTPRGLMVPTIRFADLLSLQAIAGEAARLSVACRDGRAAPQELAPGTFTVTNLGGLGVEHFTPVLNPPQVAILGVSAIGLKAVQSEAGVDHVPHLGLSLTIDHRAVDGAPAARFLQALCSALAQIDLTLAL